MRRIDRIYIHCSAVPWGTVTSIRQGHIMPPPEGRGWREIGYHWVIENGFVSSHRLLRLEYDASRDGLVCQGRPVADIGAHVAGDNETSIGICLVGFNAFSQKQMHSLMDLLRKLQQDHSISPDRIYGHREFWQMRGQPIKKDCPFFDVASIREILKRPTPV